MSVTTQDNGKPFPAEPLSVICKSTMSRKGKIYWLSTEEDGRKNYPTMETYYATTYIAQLSSYWSITIHLLQPNECISDCKVSFLVDKAPYEILNTIENLDIYEGPKKVATIYFQIN